MVQILENNEKTFLDSLLGGALRGSQQYNQLQPFFENMNMQKQNKEAIANLMGEKGSDIANLRPDLQKLFVEKFAKSPDFQHIRNALIKNGVSPEDADLYTMLTVGGQTAFVKDLLESKKRGQNVDNTFDFNQFTDEIPQKFEEIEENNISEGKPIKTGKKNELAEHLRKQDEGLTPSEKVARGKERFDSGLKVYQEANSKLRGLTGDLHRINVLEDIESTGKLPKNLGRLNVDKDGNLKLPFLASRESQRFIKTLNEFAASAKDTFGSRVTNFDLVQHLKRFPTLLNSAEGRKDILKQMKIVNEINSVYYKNLKNVYDESGGVRNIDADVAERFAEQRSEKKIAQLAEKFKTIGQFTTLPNPSEFKGKKIKETSTGQILISDGNEWIPE